MGITRRGLWLRLAVLSLWFTGGICAEQHPSRPPPSEIQLKADFLLSFIRFVDWPSDAFASPNSPFVIGLLGSDPFGPYLDSIVSGEKVNGRRVVIDRFRWVGEIGPCHVLFISGSEGPRIHSIEHMLKHSPILTVCDWQGYDWSTAMVRFSTERAGVRLHINLDEARAARLNLSAKLLRCADSVTDRKGGKP